MNTEFRNFMIALTVVLLAVVEVLDITIVAVALRDMQGAMAASPTQITWVVTVYVVGAAIFMPLTGFLSTRFGRKRLLIGSAIIFGGASLLCGLSTSLMQLLIFRGIQGVTGALLPTLAQSTLLDTFRGKSSNKMMAVYGMGIMIGPILGPVLGGWVTDHMGWRWIFFINVPVCILASISAWVFLQETLVKKIKTDWMGLGLLALGVGALQFILDKGNEQGWFSSHILQLVGIVAVLAIIVFIVRGLGKKDNIVRLRIFRDRNYTLACIAMLIYSGLMLGIYSWLPLWMELFMNYPPTLAGMLMAPRGIACLAVMAVIPFIMKYMDARWWVILACLLFGIGNIMMSHFDLLQGPDALILPNIIAGLGTGFFFVPLTALAYQTIPNALLDEASGLFNFSRSLGGSVGVAAFSTIVATQAQVNWHNLTHWITPFNENFKTWLQAHHYNINDPVTYQHLSNLLNSQSNMIAFNDATYAFSIAVLVLIPVVFFIRPTKVARPEQHIEKLSGGGEVSK